MNGWPKCLVCGEAIEPRNARTLFEVTGFERERNQGGTNHLIARRRTGRVVCARHAEQVQRDLPAEQVGLF